MKEIIQETFDLYNDPDLTYDPVVPAEIPYLQILFRVSEPYFVKETNGVPTLTPEVHQRFLNFRRQFTKTHADMLKYGVSLTGFAPMDKITKIVTAFKTDVEKQFTISGKIELDSINLKGDWVTFNSPLDSPMRQKMAE